MSELGVIAVGCNGELTPPVGSNSFNGSGDVVVKLVWAGFGLNDGIAGAEAVERSKEIEEALGSSASL